MISVADDKPSSRVIGWGMNSGGQSIGVPSANAATNEVMVDGHILSNCVAITAGRWQGLALLQDGTIAGWGRNPNGETTGTPSQYPTNGIVTVGGRILSNVVSVSAGTIFDLALCRNGTFVGWGSDESGQLNIPVGLSNVVAFSAGKSHSLALRRDGTVVRWPPYSPASAFVQSLSNIVAVSATRIEWGDNLVLKQDGTVVKWNRGIGSVRTPTGLSNIVAVAAGGRGGHGLALTKDGLVVDLKENSPDWSVHEGLSNVVAIAAGGSQSMALKRDGTLVVWGGRFPYRATVPEGLTNVVAIAAGEDFCLAIQTNSAGPIRNAFPELPKLSGKP